MDWAGISPDYFSPYCSDSPDGGMPQNVVGYQYPHSGHAYSGITTFANAGKDTSSSTYSEYHNLRDYVQDSLSKPLLVGIRYYVTFYVSLADSVLYACNNIGAYFSDSSLNYNSRTVLSYHTPQVTNDTVNHLTDKVYWMKISGSFVAKGGEQYVVIGNFIDDSKVDTIFVNSLASHVNYNDWSFSYYYIDDIIITADSNYADSLFQSVPTITTPQQQVIVYPNPSKGVFNFQSEIRNTTVSIEVYNTLGQEVYNSLSIEKSTFSIDISSQPQGVYLYRLLTKQGELIQNGKLIIE
jgi:hypothetical protein